MKQSVYISIITLFQLLLALTFQVVILRLFGMTEQLDLFFASNTISFIFVAIASSSFNYALTPILIKLKSKNRLIRLRRLANSYINLFIIIFSIFALIQIMYSEAIAAVLFPGFIGGENKQLANMLSIQSVIAIFSILVGVLNAINYTHNKLYRTAFLPFFAIVLQFICVYMTYEFYGIYSLVLATAINQIFLFLTLSFGYYKFYLFKIKFDKIFMNSIQKVFPLLFSAAFSKSDLLVNRYFASTLAAGAISSLHFGVLAISVLSTFVNKGISIVSLRYFSVTNTKNSYDYFYNLCKVMLIISSFIVINVILFSPIIFDLILSGETFTVEKLESLYFVILSLLGYLIGGILSSVIVNPFYTGGITAVVSKVSISLQILAIFSMIIFFQLYGFYALPIVMSLKSIINSLLLLFLYNRLIHKFAFLNFTVFVLRLITTGVLLVIFSSWWMGVINPFLLMVLLAVVYIICFADFIPKKYYKKVEMKQSL